MVSTTVTPHTHLIPSHDLTRDGWPRLASALGLTRPSSVAIPLSPDALGAWGIPKELASGRRISVLSDPTTPCRVLVVEGESSTKTRRALARAVHRHNPGALVLWWFVDAHALRISMLDEHTPVTLSLARRLEDDAARTRLHALDIRHLVARDTLTTEEAVRRHILGVLSQEHLTRAFFARLTRAFDELEATMIHGPSDPDARHDLALMTLLRLIVLYLLQSRGALDHDPRFISRVTSAARADGRDIWRDVLAPLCFEALNTPGDARHERVLAMGRFPFLNGGLFEPSPLEQPHPELT